MSENGIQSLEPLVHESLKSKVARSLRLAIQTGQLEPGQRLVEEEIASQLGVSRVPVREAIRVLEADGILVTEHGRGASVANPSVVDIEDIYGLRIALETYCLSIIIDTGDEEVFAVLQSLVDKMSEWRSGDDRANLLELDLVFHERMCEMSNNERLLSTWRSQMAQLRMLLVLSDAYIEDPSGIALGHQKIVNALRHRDFEEAQKVLLHHFDKSKERILRDRKDIEK